MVLKETLKKKIISAAALMLVALVSVFLLSDVAASPKFHAETLASLEEKQETVLELTAVSTAVSTAITLLPGDAATPIADKLADLSSGFLLVLCAIYLEKYLLTITGYAAFQILIPVSCVLFAASMFIDWRPLKGLAKKLLIFGTAIVLVIPASVQLSDLIEETYQSSIEETIETAKEATAEVERSAEQEAGGGESLGGWFDKIKDGVTTTVKGAADKVSNVVNRMIEALAVMIVTACAIPILVLLFFVWLVKTIFSIDLSFGRTEAPFLKGAQAKAKNSEMDS